MNFGRLRAEAPPGAGQLDAARMLQALRRMAPPLLFGVRMCAAVCLALHIAFWLQLDNAFWAGTSAAIVCTPSFRLLADRTAQALIGIRCDGLLLLVDPPARNVSTARSAWFSVPDMLPALFVRRSPDPVSAATFPRRMSGPRVQRAFHPSRDG